MNHTCDYTNVSRNRNRAYFYTAVLLFKEKTFNLIIPALFEEKAGDIVMPLSVWPAGRPPVRNSVCDVTPLLLDPLS